MVGDTCPSTSSHSGTVMNWAAASTCINPSMHLDLSMPSNISMFLTTYTAWHISWQVPLNCVSGSVLVDVTGCDGH